MRRLISSLGLAALLLGSAVVGAEPQRNLDLVVVVNKSTALQTLSLDELRNIYLGERSVWPDGRRILPTAFGTGTPEFQSFLKSICRMSEADYKRYFLQLSFEGKPVIQPRILNSASAVRAFVSSSPGSIGLLHPNEVDGSVVVVKLENAAQKSSSRRH